MDILRCDPVFYVFDTGLHQRIEGIIVFLRREKAELRVSVGVCIRIRKVIRKGIRAEADSLDPVFVGQIGVIAKQVKLKDAQDGKDSADGDQRRASPSEAASDPSDR